MVTWPMDGAAALNLFPLHASALGIAVIRGSIYFIDVQWSADMAGC